MRQVRIVLIVGIGILALCGVAIATSLMDYVSRPGVTVAHVPPVVAPLASAPEQAAAPAPLPSTPVTSAPVQQSQAQAPQAPDQRTVPAAMTAQQAQQDALARFLEELRQHRRTPRPR